MAPKLSAGASQLAPPLDRGAIHDFGRPRSSTAERFNSVATIGGTVGLRSVVGFFVLQAPLEDGGVERNDGRVDVHIGPQ